MSGVPKKSGLIQNLDKYYHCSKCKFKSPFKRLFDSHFLSHKKNYQCNEIFMSTSYPTDTKPKLEESYNKPQKMKKKYWAYKDENDGPRNEGIIEEKWYHGEIGCAEAEARLQSADQVGSFLVRSVGTLFIISFVRSADRIKHLRLPKVKNNAILVENPHLKTDYEVIKYLLGAKNDWLKSPLDKPDLPTKMKRDEHDVFSCKICEDRDNSKHHSRIHRIHMCKRCKDIVFDSGSTTHEANCNPESSFECQICGKRFKLLYVLKKHEKLCLVSLQCKMCGQRFNKEETLRNHETNVHRKQISCEECGVKCTTMSGWRTHKSSFHNPEKVGFKNALDKYQCSDCQFTCPLKRQFDSHLLTHRKIYQCDECSYSSLSNMKYRKHKQEEEKNKLLQTEVFVGY